MQARCKGIWVGMIAVGALSLVGCRSVDSAKSRALLMETSSPISENQTAGRRPSAAVSHAVAPQNPDTAKTLNSPALEFAQDYDEQFTIKVSPIADTAPDRYLIKNATITVEAGDVRGVTAKVIAVAKQMKGYVSNMHETVDALDTRSVTFTVRVPFNQFDNFLQGFEAQGKVLDREVTAEDVTEEFVDTQSKVHNLHATEGRLLTHLSKTGKLSDTLLVEKEINRVREEIDRLTGRLKFLAHRISFSTFTVTIKETAHAQAITPPETFSAGKVASDSARSLIGFGQQVVTIAIWLLTWSVVWLPPILILGYYQWRRRRGSVGNARS